jgi:acyl CoA:acetate/3-ketoacid CoA transferase alpha subunit
MDRDMSDTTPNPCIIRVAITGSLPAKDNNPAVPITIAEQIESTQEAFEVGATIAHCHVRDDEGKEHRDFGGQSYILERGFRTDLSIVKAWKADPSGNLVFRKTARNFNPPAATCGKVCVAEVEEIVPLGSLDPDAIHTPGIYVHRLIQGTHEKRIEQRTTRKAA